MNQEKKQPSGNDVESYKTVLKEALALGDRLNIKTKEDVIAYKDMPHEYIRLVENYSATSADLSSEGQWSEREENEAQMKNARDELQALGTEIMSEVQKIKTTFS